VFKKMRARAVAQIEARVGRDRILLLEDGANSFGVESRGRWQIRGNGCLAATADEILFIMWWPRREVRIPRSAITGVERARSHLGKTVGHQLLRVHFTSAEGRPDSIAWWVRDVSRWETLLAAPRS
jgi:hypothetical protein